MVPFCFVVFPLVVGLTRPQASKRPARLPPYLLAEKKGPTTTKETSCETARVNPSRPTPLSMPSATTMEVQQRWVQVHPTGLVKPNDLDAKSKIFAAETLRGVVTGEMWKNEHPFRLAPNKASLGSASITLDAES